MNLVQVVNISFINLIIGIKVKKQKHTQEKNKMNMQKITAKSLIKEVKNKLKQKESKMQEDVTKKSNYLLDEFNRIT